MSNYTQQKFRLGTVGARHTGGHLYPLALPYNLPWLGELRLCC